MRIKLSNNEIEFIEKYEKLCKEYGLLIAGICLKVKKIKKDDEIDNSIGGLLNQ